MKKSKRNLRKTKRSKRNSHKLKHRKKSKALKARKHMKYTRKSYRLKGGGNLIPQGLENTWRGVEDYFHKMYNNFTGDQSNWSNSDPVNQPALLKDLKAHNKIPDIRRLNESADLSVYDNLLN